jgi:hypothetical protein
MAAMIADNIRHHSLAAQILHAINHGDLKTILARLAYLKILRSDVIELRTGSFVEDEAIQGLSNAGKCSFCQEDMLPWHV